MKTFFGKIAAFFEKLFGKGNLNNTISSVLKIVVPLVAGVIGLVAPEAEAAEVTAAVNEVVSDFGVVSGLVQTFDPLTGDAKAQIVSILGGIKANLAALLAAGHIKDAALTAKVTTIFGIVTGEIDAILAAL
jgi:hypothetical protein